MQKILIADGAAGLRDQLYRSLSSKYEVACVQDGIQAWNLIMKLQPDLLVLDIEMPGLDGITLLQRMYAEGCNPAVMVVSRMLSDYTVDTLVQMGIGYLVRKPCDVRIVATRAEELLEYHVHNARQRLEDICAILKELGIPLHLRGGKYLPQAIIRMAYDPSQFMTKELYPSVGKRFGTCGARVERCIRNVVEKGWKSGNNDAWKRYFGTEPDTSSKGPNNTEFMTQIVEILKNQTK